MIKQPKKSIFGFIFFTYASILLASFALSADAATFDDDYSSLNKKVEVKSGVTAGEISSVNGKVKVGDNVTADEISSVNGKIDIGDNLIANEVSSVNGKVQIGREARIEESVEAVNGKIKIGDGSKVGANVETVNGSIELINVAVAQNVETVNGSVYLKDGTVVEGDVIIGGPNHNKNSWSKGWNNKPPKLIVDSQSSIQGKIIVYRDVDFDFADQSLMGKVEDRSGLK